MSYLLPQFKCQPDVFSIHFKSQSSLSHFVRGKDTLHFKPQSSLSTASPPSSSLLDPSKLRFPSLETHSDPLASEKPWTYFESFVPPLATETLIKEDALIAAAAAEAVALARAAAKVAKEAAQMMEISNSMKDEGKLHHNSSESATQRWPRLTELERAHILEDASISKVNGSIQSPPSIPEPLEEELELLEKQLAVKSTKHKERRSKRVRASEKTATTNVTIKPSTTKKKRTPIQEVDYSDPLRYLRGTTGSSRLLTSKEELILSEGIQDLLKLEKINEELKERSGVEPTFSQWAAAVGIDQKQLRKRLNNGMACKDKMITSNIRLVISIAKRYQGSGMNLQDLVQEGCRGLVRGAEKFDASKGFKFSTYAHWWIKQSVRKSLSDQSRTIRLPFHVVEASYKVREARKALSMYGGSPNDEEVAEAAGLSMKRLNTVLLAPKLTLSLDQKMGANMDLKPSEVVADPDAELAEEVLMRQFMKEDLGKVLNSLNARENQVIKWRFGIEDGRTKTLQEIGEIMGVSRERVRQIELNAFRKLKNKKRTKHLNQYVSS